MLDWKAPSTSVLTDLVRSMGFYAKDGERITEKIFQSLVTTGHDPKQINFETIINVIDEFITYYSYFDKENKIPSLILPFLTSSTELGILLNFCAEWNRKQFSLKIPSANPDYENQLSHNKETPEQFFFQLLMVDLIGAIVNEISNYSLPKQVESNIDNALNNSFYNWMKSYAENDEIIRIYTLNYDSIFKIILEKHGTPIFEGFESKIEIYDPAPANIIKIVSEVDSNIHYNLHGSAYWEVVSRNINDLPGYQYNLLGAPHFPFNDLEPAFAQVEKGRNLLLTNIITGYQKTQRTALSPFKQIHAAFDRDCILTERIFIVGYSFGDEHVNESIRTAIKHNKDVEFIIVDLGFDDKMEIGLYEKFFSHKEEINQSPEKINDKLISFPQFKAKVHKVTFKEFLSNKLYQM